jgi:hypothetical protein
MKVAVKQTGVCVVWGPADEKSPNGILQVTVRLGTRRSTEDHLAVQALLDAVKRIQDLPDPQPG